MSKQTITKTWLAGLLINLAGAVVSGLITEGWLANVVGGTAGPHAYLPDDSFWAAMTFNVLCGLVAAGGFIVQLAAWIEALLNSQRLADKTWFNALLWVGSVGFATSPLFGLGALVLGGVMIAYLVGAPDGMAVRQPPTVMPAARPTTIPATS